jgi:hypothetical protein
MDEPTITIVLRLIHILAGIFWVGAIFLIAGFLLVSGFTMYARLAAATEGVWASTPPGIGYGVGGLAAILGAVIGAAVSGPAARRMAVLGREASQGSGLSAEQQAEMKRLQTRSALGGRITAGFLAVAAGAMAIARYL